MDAIISMRGTVYEQGYGLIAQKVMRDKRLSIKAKAIYAYLSSFAGSGTDRTAFPGVSLMMDELGIKSRDTYYKYRNELEEAGYITVESQKDERGRFSRNIYYIEAVPVPKIGETDEPPKSQEPQGVSPCPKKQDTDPCPKNSTTVNRTTENMTTNNNSFTSINSNNLDGWTGGDALKNSESKTIGSRPIDDVKREWERFKGLCQKEGLDGAQTMELWKIYKHQYRRAPVTVVMSILRELLHDRYNLDGSQQDYRSIEGLFHHRMQAWREMAVAFEDLEQNGGWK